MILPPTKNGELVNQELLASLLLSAFSHDTEAGNVIFATGRLSSASQGAHTTSYSYTANTDWVGSVAHAKNSSSLFTQRTHRDLGGQVVGVISRGGAAANGTMLVSAGYVIDSKGRRTRLTREDGTRWEFGYNTRDEVTSGKKRASTSGDLLAGQQYEYAYDDIGNRITAKFGGDGSGAALRTIGYTANSTNQYSAITHPGHVQIVGYSDSTEPIEASSNIVGSSLSQVGSTTVQGNRWRAEVLNSAANGVWEDLKVEQEVSGTPTSIGGGKLWIPPSSASPTYDGDGNLTYDGRWNYTWNGENRLIQLETCASAQTAGHPWMRLSFKYDYMGRRIEKMVETGSSGSPTLALKHIFLYDAWNVIAEINTIPTTAQTVTTYLWGTDLSGSEQGAGGVGGLLLCHTDTDSDGDVDSNDTAHIPAYDGNGNIIAWLDDTANVVVRMDYSPFGQTISKSGDVAGLHFGFSTKYQDEESGLYYYGYRYLDVNTGRWPSRDPIDEEGGANLYGFVNNEPIRSIDNMGLSTLTVTVTRYGRTPNAIHSIVRIDTDDENIKRCCPWIPHEYHGIETARTMQPGRTGARKPPIYIKGVPDDQHDTTNNPEDYNLLDPDVDWHSTFDKENSTGPGGRTNLKDRSHKYAGKGMVFPRKPDFVNQDDYNKAVAYEFRTGDGGINIHAGADEGYSEGCVVINTSFFGTDSNFDSKWSFLDSGFADFMFKVSVACAMRKDPDLKIRTRANRVPQETPTVVPRVRNIQLPER